MVLVTEPSDVSVADVMKTYNLCRMLKVKVFGVVYNRAYLKCKHCDSRLFPFGDMSKISVPFRKHGVQILPLPMVEPENRVNIFFGKSLSDMVDNQRSDIYTKLIQFKNFVSRRN